jgi:hypothetical protein
VERLFVSRDVEAKICASGNLMVNGKESLTALSFSHTVIPMAFKAHAPLL